MADPSPTAETPRDSKPVRRSAKPPKVGAISASIQDLKRGLGLKGRVRAIEERRDTVLTMLAEAAILADVKCREVEEVAKARERAASMKKRGAKAEAAAKEAREQLAEALRKLGRHVVENELKLEDEEERIAEVPKLDAAIEALEAQVVGVPRLILRQTALLALAGGVILLLAGAFVAIRLLRPEPLPKATLFALAERMRAFNPVHAWADFEPEERKALETPIAKPALPEALADHYRAKSLLGKWNEATVLVDATPWATVSLKEGIGALAKGITALKAAGPEELGDHPQAPEFRALYESVERGAQAKLKIYLDRLCFERVKLYAEAARAIEAQDAEGALALAWGFVDYKSEPEGLELGKLDPTVAALCREAARRSPEEIEAAGRQVIRSLRGRARPSERRQAVLMYDAQDFVPGDAPKEVAPGAWCAYSGDFAGVSSGYYILRRGATDYVAFDTGENLDLVPNGAKIEVVGWYKRIEEFTTPEGQRTRCPYIDDCFVYRVK